MICSNLCRRHGNDSDPSYAFRGSRSPNPSEHEFADQCMEPQDQLVRFVANRSVDAQPIRRQVNAIAHGKQQDQFTYSVELLEALPLAILVPDFLKGLVEINQVFCQPIPRLQELLELRRKIDVPAQAIQV